MPPMCGTAAVLHLFTFKIYKCIIFINNLIVYIELNSESGDFLYLLLVFFCGRSLRRRGPDPAEPRTAWHLAGQARHCNKGGPGPSAMTRNHCHDMPWLSVTLCDSLSPARSEELRAAPLALAKLRRRLANAGCSWKATCYCDSVQKNPKREKWLETMTSFGNPWDRRSYFSSP